MTNKSHKNIFKTFISLIMALLLLLPLVMSSCTADDKEISKFNRNMTDEEYNAEANRRIKYVLSTLFPSLYDRFKDQTIKTTLNEGAMSKFTYKVNDVYDTSAYIAINLTTDLKLKSVVVNGPIGELEQLSKKEAEEIVNNLKSQASTYGATLTDDEIKFEQEKDDLVAYADIDYDDNGISRSERLTLKIDHSLVERANKVPNEKDLRKKLDPFIKEMFYLKDLSEYNVFLEDNKLQYQFCLYGYKSSEIMQFRYWPDSDFPGFSYEIDKFASVTEYKDIVTEKDLDKALEKLRQKSGKDISKEDCLLYIDEEYLVMHGGHKEVKVASVYNLADDELAAIKQLDKNYTPDYSGLSDEYVEMRKKADAAIMEKYGLQSFSNYDISIGSNKDYTSHGVSYTLMIGGLKVDEELHVSFDNEYNITSVFGNFGEWSWLFAYIDNEEIKAKIERLDGEFVEETGLPLEEGSVRITIDANKNLMFRREAIIHTEPGQGDSHGDHYHYFQTEYLFVYNSLKKTSK